jgi:ABC-type glycerol-3-phosphate transport system substrate-binding protein
LFFIGCSKQESKIVTINYWDSMPPTEPVGQAIQKLIKEFEEKILQ